MIPVPVFDTTVQETIRKTVQHKQQDYTHAQRLFGELGIDDKFASLILGIVSAPSTSVTKQQCVVAVADTTLVKTRAQRKPVQIGLGVARIQDGTCCGVPGLVTAANGRNNCFRNVYLHQQVSHCDHTCVHCGCSMIVTNVVTGGTAGATVRNLTRNTCCVEHSVRHTSNRRRVHAACDHV